MSAMPGAVLALMLVLAAAATAEAQTPGALIEAGDYAAAERMLSERLAADADDIEARYLRARARGFDGRYDAALADYDVLLAQFPDDVDFRFGRAQVLGWSGRDAEALSELEAAAELAPDYEAIWQAWYAVARRQADADDRLASIRSRARARFPDADWWRPTAETAPDQVNDFPMTLTVGGSWQDLDNSLPGWNDQFAEFGWRATSDLTLQAGIARSARFNRSDLGLTAGAEWRFAEGWNAGLHASATSDADFLAGRGYRAHIGRALPAGWGFDLGYNRREFATATVSAWSLMTEKYLGNYRFAYTLGLAHLHSAADSVSHVATVSRYWSKDVSLGLTVATGEEAEVVAPGQVLITDVSGVSVNGRYRLNERVTVTLWAGVHEQGDFYRRRYAGLAFAIGL